WLMLHVVAVELYIQPFSFSLSYNLKFVIYLVELLKMNSNPRLIIYLGLYIMGDKEENHFDPLYYNPHDFKNKLADDKYSKTDEAHVIKACTCT
ncbi:hypothetical protein ACJX0J_014713, partial [Zea mays]